MPQTRLRWLPSVFYVDGGLESQGHALAKFVAMRYATPPLRAAILSADAQRTRFVAAAIQHQCQHAGWPALEEIDVPHGPFDAALP
jgi:hypothetical protein